MYVGAALLFMVLGGVLALVMRTQLAVPDNDLVSHQTYNQLFTMHGTVMMFLFAVPVIEAMAVYLLPGMLGARDLPFPRLGAYAFWAYLIGGLIFFCTLFFGVAPDGGWFMYPPLTSYEYSPACARTSGCSASASSRSPPSPARSKSSSASCARARRACRSTGCRSTRGRCWWSAR